MKKLLLILVLAAAVVFVAALVYAFVPTRTGAIAATAGSADPALIEKGRYLAAAGDCTACHTAPGGRPFAGGLAIASPIGAIYSTNITPDADTGIGGYTLDQFDRALRHGIRSDGSTLYPAMPYPSYARMHDDDVEALYAYFMHGVQPVKAENRKPGIVWPLSMRWPLAIWRKTFAPDPGKAGFDPARYADAQVARGAYLVQGPGHCGSCHTPRAPTLQEKALDESGADYLAGGQVIDGWGAMSLRGDAAAGLGRWSAQDIADLLKTGRNRHAAVVGPPMADVVEHSTQHLSDADLAAIAAYLKTLPASAGSPASFSPGDATAKALRAGIDDSRGGELYVDNCAGCHRTDAAGYDTVFPAIAGNATVLAQDPTSLLHLILAGSSMPATATRPSDLGMPGFAWRLDDAEVATLATYLRSSWGNRAPAVTAAQVAKVRKTLGDTPGPVAADEAVQATAGQPRPARS
ncbi:MAG: cytochrome c [Pseudoxanthomonas sp.]